MSAFNYRTKKESYSGLADLVYRIARIIEKLVFWEVNDIALGAERLRRRRVKCLLTNGIVSKGPWFEIDTGGVDSIVAGAGISISPTTGLGDVTITNTGVTQLAAGTGLSVSAGTGSVTISHGSLAVYVGGRSVTVTGTPTNYLKVALDGSSASYVAAMVDPMPDDYEYYDLTKREFHLPGNFAG